MGQFKSQVGVLGVHLHMQHRQDLQTMAGASSSASATVALVGEVLGPAMQEEGNTETFESSHRVQAQILERLPGTPGSLWTPRKT